MKQAPLIAVVLLLSAAALAAPKAPRAAKKTEAAIAASDQISLRPEVIGAKTFLEDLLIRRYSLELGTRIEKGSFSVGAELTLAEAPAAVAVSDKEEPPADFLLGTLDPEELIKRYSTDAESAAQAQGFLRNFRIRGVSVSVGVKEELGPTAKAAVETWLSDRLKGEFGAIAKGTVSVVAVAAAAPEKKTIPAPKSAWERLDQFQSLTGQLLLSLAILLGAVFFAILSKRGKQAAETGAAAPEAPPANANASPGAPAPAAHSAESDESRRLRDEEAAAAVHEEKEIVAKLFDVLPGLNGKYDRMIHAWCQTGGDEGRLKLACFAGAVGKTIGKLPIPSECTADVTKAFSRMPELKPAERRDVLRKVYWDVLTALNLGPEAFDRPFGYLGNLNVGMVKNALMDQNPRLKALVALYMPNRLREDFIRSQPREEKLALLAQAAQMSEVPSAELKSFDEVLKQRTLRPVGADSLIPLDMPLVKLIGSLSPIDEIQLLSEASRGADRDAFQAYKRSTPSLAFLSEWRDDKLSRLLTRCDAEELVAFLRVVPEVKDRFTALCRPMTAELVNDEFARPDTKNEVEKNRLLAEFSKRLKEMFARNELSLADVFNAEAPVPEIDAPIDNVRKLPNAA